MRRASSRIKDSPQFFWQFPVMQEDHNVFVSRILDWLEEKKAKSPRFRSYSPSCDLTTNATLRRIRKKRIKEFGKPLSMIYTFSNRWDSLMTMTVTMTAMKAECGISLRLMEPPFLGSTKNMRMMLSRH